MKKEENLRKEQLKELEYLHKDALCKRAEDFHRSTKTTIKKFQGTHLKLRDKYYAYKVWHNFRFANKIHWLLLFFVLFATFSYLSKMYYFVTEGGDIPENHAVIVGESFGDDVTAEFFSKSNVNFSEKNALEIEDKGVNIGFVKKRVYLNELVSWKDVSWRSDIPKGTSIVYRIKTSKSESEEDLEKVQWSDYYTIKDGIGKTYSGIPNIKSRALEIEVILQGDSTASPKLNYLYFGYTPFEENQTLVKIKNLMFFWIERAFNFLARKEGIYTD